MSFSCQWGKKVNLNKKLWDLVAFWGPDLTALIQVLSEARAKKKEKNKQDFATKFLTNQHKRCTERLFTAFIVLSFLCLFGFF